MSLVGILKGWTREQKVRQRELNFNIEHYLADPGVYLAAGQLITLRFTLFICSAQQEDDSHCLVQESYRGVNVGWPLFCSITRLEKFLQ